MDTLFRKKRSRQINEPDRSNGSYDRFSAGRTSTSGAPHPNGSPITISGPSSNPHVSKEGRSAAYLSPSSSSSHDFDPSGAGGHSRNSSNVGSHVGPSDSASYVSGMASRSSRYASSTTGSIPESNGLRMPASTNDILNRMSLASASAASIGMAWGPEAASPPPQSRPSYNPAPSGPRQSSSSHSSSPANQRPPAGGEFFLNRPSDVEVERMFAEMMDRRDFLGGNAADKENARRNMLMFNVDKKWALVYNDRLTEWMSAKERERNRRQQAHSNQSGNPRGLIITRNSPEWFIKKFMDGSVTTKDIESLAVTLRTCAMGWIQSFVEAKGTPVLASFLNGLHAKQIRSENDIALEYEVLKAFRSLFNSKPGANDALAQPKCISGIAHSMISAHLATRKQAADILLFLCHWEKPTGHRLVLQGFDDIKASQSDHGRFDAWFRVLELTIDGRGTMGSRVGASDEVRKLSIVGPQESSLNEYAINNMFLINAILSTDIVPEFEVRVHLRNQMEASGLQRILIKMKAFKNQDLDAQISAFESNAAQDHEDVVETFNRDVLTDMSDPVDVFKAIVEKVSGSRAYDFFLSSLQHLLLIRQEGDHLVHWYQLIDSLVTSVVMDRKGAVERSDISSLLGTSVNNVLSRFADQDHMQALESEVSRFKAEARTAEQERAKLQAQLEEESEGLVGKLKAQIAALEEDLEVSRGNALALQRDIEDMEKGYIDRIVALEVQNRDIYEMMREKAGKDDIFPGGKATLDRQEMVDTLERQLERDRTIRKLEANARKEGRSLPSSGPEREAVIEEAEKQAQRERISSSVRRESMRQRQLSEEDEQQEKPAAATESEEEESDLEPTSEAAKWKIQATLAAGMAQNAALAERMNDARATRRRKTTTKVEDSQADLTPTPSAPIPLPETPSTVGPESGDVPPPPPPPPPPIPTSSGPSLLDEIRNRKALRSAAPVSNVTSDMGPPPPPPPPPPPAPAAPDAPPPPPAPPAPPAPPPPPALQSAFSPSESPASSRPESFMSDAPPPPPPPPPPAPGSATPFTPRTVNGVPATPASAATPGVRDSMLNVRASYAGDIGPAGPTAAPPPPPMNGLFGNQMATRKEVLEMAKTRMKQLQWDKLSPQHAAETVWGKPIVEEDQLATILRSEGFFDEMEEDFKAKQAAKRQTAAAKKDKFEFKTHLTRQTTQGIEMVLKRVKSSLTDSKHATPEELAHHIVNCNDVVLDQSLLTELLRHYPESEIKGQLGEYRNASDEELRLLHPADRLVVLLMTVPHLKEKVKGLLYMTKYKEAFDLIKEGSMKIRDGSEALVKAEGFAKLLGIILMMGNYLNATGVQGGAFGFKISSINKLVDTKASDGTTLLHFVERTVSKAFPEVESFLDELEHPSEACRVQLLDLKRELAELKSGSLQHKKELDRFIDEDESHLQDPYTKLMLPFLNDAISKLTRLSDQVQLTERTYVEALRYFGEGPDPKRRGFPAAQPMRTEDFFGIFKEFVAAYRKVKKDNIRISEQRQIEAKRRAAAEEREKERLEALARKEAGVDDSLVLETLLGNLRGGGHVPKNKRKARERGAARRAKESLGPSDALPTGAGNPSEMAQAMLAQLQGGSPSSATASPPPRERPTRRRDRRTGGLGGEGGASGERNRDSLGSIGSGGGHGAAAGADTGAGAGDASSDKAGPHRIGSPASVALQEALSGEGETHDTGTAGTPSSKDAGPSSAPNATSPRSGSGRGSRSGSGSGSDYGSAPDTRAVSRQGDGEGEGEGEGEYEEHFGSAYGDDEQFERVVEPGSGEGSAADAKPVNPITRDEESLFKSPTLDKGLERPPSDTSPKPADSIAEADEEEEGAADRSTSQLDIGDWIDPDSSGFGRANDD